MRSVVVFVACLSIVAAVPANPQRIVGGEITSIENYPFGVALLYSWTGSSYTQYCGGSMLTTTSILTAAHCVIYDSPYQWRSRVGSSSKSSGGLVYETLSLTTHPDYDSRIYEHDIALIRTTSSIDVNNYNIAPGQIAGPNYIPADNEPVWAIGWGATSSGGFSSEQLRHVQIWTVNQQICRDRYAERGNTVTENMLCSGWLDVGGRDQCQGDSGGPLLHNGVIVGVCSWGNACALPRFPGVNTRVSRYTSWIQSNT